MSWISTYFQGLVTISFFEKSNVQWMHLLQPFLFVILSRPLHFIFLPKVITSFVLFFYRIWSNAFMSSGGCILVTNLTGCNNKTNVSPKRKMRRMCNYLMEELGWKSSCFSPVPAQMVNYTSSVHMWIWTGLPVMWHEVILSCQKKISIKTLKCLTKRINSKYVFQKIFTTNCAWHQMQCKVIYIFSD